LTPVGFFKVAVNEENNFIKTNTNNPPSTPALFLLGQSRCILVPHPSLLAQRELDSHLSWQSIKTTLTRASPSTILFPEETRASQTKK
jgi:hypothetical protein